MKKTIQAVAMTALILLCFDFSKAQGPDDTKHIVGLDIAPVIRRSAPGLMYNLKLNNGVLRVRGRLSNTAHKRFQDGNPFSPNNTVENNFFFSFLALGWQKEYRKDFFVFYYGGELMGTRSVGITENFSSQEEFENHPGTEALNESEDRVTSFGVSGVLGIRFRLKDHISIGLESGLPLAYELRDTKSRSFRWDVIDGNSVITDLSVSNLKNRTFTFKPLQEFSVFLNFHF